VDSYIKVKGTEGAVTNGGITVGVLPFSKVGLEIGVDYRDLGVAKMQQVIQARASTLISIQYT